MLVMGGGGGLADAGWLLSEPILTFCGILIFALGVLLRKTFATAPKLGKDYFNCAIFFGGIRFAVLSLVD